MIAFLVFMKRKLYINDWNEIKNMLWVYSVSYHDEEINNIFSRCIREATDGGVEKDVYLPRVFDIEITNIKSPGIVLNDTDYKEIVDLIKCMLFTDVDQLIKNDIDIREKATHSVDREEGVTPNVEMDLMDIEIDSLSIKISFDYFLNNMCNYDEQCRKLTEWILDTIYDKDIFYSIILERDDIANSIYKKLRVAEWIKWKKHTKIKSLKELFPLKSLGYMVGMAERLDYRLRKERTLSFAKLYENFRVSITEYMKECNEYYFMEKYIKRYPDSVITSEMLEKIVELIELRKEPGLLSAIWILHNLVYAKNTVIDTIGIERIDRLLFFWAELINYDNAAMKDIKHCIELRQACAALAFRLFDWKTVNCGKGVEKWREICKSSDEANEVRNQWIW